MDINHISVKSMKEEWEKKIETENDVAETRQIIAKDARADKIGQNVSFQKITEKSDDEIKDDLMKELGKNIKTQTESHILPQIRRNQILSDDFEEIYDEETEFVKIYQTCPQSTSNEQKLDTRHLVKQAFVVELNGGKRYLGYLFLFSDVLVCTKYKTGAQEQLALELQWFIPISQVRPDIF